MMLCMHVHVYVYVYELKRTDGNVFLDMRHFAAVLCIPYVWPNI